MYYAWSRTISDLLDACKGKKCCLLSHRNLDGDAIGSLLAIYGYLKSLNASVAVASAPIPRIYVPFFEGISFIKAADINPDPQASVCIAVDCADNQRLEGDFVARNLPIEINIDHHLGNSEFAAHNFVDPKACATSEIIARVFFDLAAPISPQMASALYVGIVKDSNRFQLPTTTADTLFIASRLVQLGASIEQISNRLFECETLNHLQLLQRFLASLKFFANKKACIGILTEDDFRETGTTLEDADNFSQYPRSIEGVEIAVVVECLPDGSFKGSLRSKTPQYRVDTIARKFGGGGHLCASGFRRSGGSLQEFLETIMQTIGEGLGG